jgi:hypothetical protein
MCKCSSIFVSKRDAETDGDSNTEEEMKNREAREDSGSMFFIQGFLQSGMTAWAIYEYWGVSCVHELHGKLLYLMFQIFVYLDIAATGIFVGSIVFSSCVFCFYIRHAAGNNGGDSDIVALRNAVGGGGGDENHATKQTERRVAWNV